jgi:hypothetical protein
MSKLLDKVADPLQNNPYGGAHAESKLGIFVGCQPNADRRL